MGLGLSEGLGGTRDGSANDDFTSGQDVCAKPSLVNESLDHLWWRELSGRQGLAETKAGLAKLHAAKQNRTNLEFLAYQGVESHASGDKVPSSDGQVVRPAVLGDEAFDFLGFDQCEVLARFFMSIEVPIAFDACTGNHAGRLVFMR